MVAAALFVVALLVLVGLGYLVLPGTPPPAPVTVTSVRFTIVQGTNASGLGWFGPSAFNYSGAANGYPFTVAAGGTFTISVTLWNHDNQAHTIYSAAAGAPFRVSSTAPSLPVGVAAMEDDALIQIGLVAPSTPGASLVLMVTIDTTPPPG